MEDLFGKFNEIGKIFPVYFLQTIFIILWSLLFIIPGIIKAFAYSLVPYLYLDNPDKDVSSILKESEELMKGHKADLFMLYLSYLPHHLLGIITCGIYEFYIMPQQTLAVTKFLLEIKEGKTANSGIVEAQVIEDNTQNKEEQ